MKSQICSLQRAVLFALALLASASLHSQTANAPANLVASLDRLPDEPLPQSTSQPPAPSEEDEKKKKGAEHEAGEEQLKIQEKQRMVGVIPTSTLSSTDPQSL